MKIPAAKSVLAALAILGIAGCDRALTKVTNTSHEPLVLRYWHANYDRWSPVVPFKPGDTMNLARGHHFAEVRCLDIREGPHRYRYDETALTKIHAVCDRAYSCALTYVGAGGLQAKPSPMVRLPVFFDKTTPLAAKPCR